MKGSPTNNRELALIRETYPVLTPWVLAKITNFSYTFCYGWTKLGTHSSYRQMPDAALRLLRLELGVATPSVNTARKLEAIAKRKKRRAA